MNLLLVLLSVMTFTVETKNSVTMNGQCPYDMEVAYNCSYQKGQVRSGDVATLTLGNLGGIVIEKIEARVKSNKDSGAGTFEVQVNGNTVITKSGSLKNWVGMFDNQFYHAVCLLESSVSNVNNLTIQLTGSTSSLYIEKYEITYSNGPARTVTLMNGDDLYSTLKEETGGQGVTLPDLPGLTQWQFTGWTESPFESDYTALISLYRSGMKFYPSDDVMLWAVYAYQPAPRGYATELVSGEYIYLHTFDKKAMSGLPENGKADVRAANTDDVSQCYSFVFDLPGDSATIRYAYTGEYIGYSGTKLATKKSKWAVFHEGDKTAFYISVSGKTYMLYPGIWDNDAEYTKLIQVLDISLAPTALLSTAPQNEETWYSCFPARQQAVESPAVEGREVIVPFGIYELHIQDGHKKLRIR